jgi:hypothetical protein
MENIMARSNTNTSVKFNPNTVNQFISAVGFRLPDFKEHYDNRTSRFEGWGRRTPAVLRRLLRDQAHRELNGLGYYKVNDQDIMDYIVSQPYLNHIKIMVESKEASIRIKAAAKAEKKAHKTTKIKLVA